MATRSSSRDVADKIKYKIRDDKMTSGMMLPSIEDLAAELGASKGTVREALMGLASVGVVDVQHGRGTFVGKPEVKEIVGSTLWHLNEAVNAQNILEVLRGLTMQAASLAAERATPVDISALKDSMEKLRASLRRDDRAEFASLERDFYERVALTPRNELLAHLMLFLRELLEAVHSTGINEKPDILVYEQIIWAIQEQDGVKASALVQENFHTHRQTPPDQDLVIYYDGLGTGSVGGSFYTLGQELSGLISRFTRIQPVVKATGGGIDNVRLTQERRLVVSISQIDVAINAFHGKGDFGVPSPDIRALCYLPSLELQISTLESSNIHDLYDLRGKTIAIGAQGGASSRVAKRVLRSYNLEPEVDYKPMIYPFSTAVEMLHNGHVDAVFFLSIGPSQALVELGCQRPLRLLPIAEDKLKKLTDRHHYWFMDSIEANTYPGQTKEIHTLGIPTVLICHKDLPNQDAYAITSVVLDNIQLRASLVYQGREFAKLHSNVETSIPIHPGAKQYFREIGVL